MRLSELPAHERPRERLLALGAHVLADAELLAIFLRTGMGGDCALGVARRLLKYTGGLRALLQHPQAAALALPGLGPARWAQLQAALELARRSAGDALAEKQTISSPRDSAAYLRAWLAPLPYEAFVVLFLDQRHRVLVAEELFRGTLNGTSVHPREVVRRVLTHNAAAVIVAHNHPSGDSEPSSPDLALTRLLRDALALIDVRLLDHFIIGAGEPTSLAERGLI